MRTLLLPATLLLTACVDYGLDEREDPPEIEVPGCASVEPASVNFGWVDIGERAEELVTIDNPCAGWLEIYEIDLVYPPSPFDLGEVGDVLLQGGESTGFTAVFEPLGGGDWYNTVHIETDDPDHEVIEVQLAGRSGS